MGGGQEQEHRKATYRHALRDQQDAHDQARVEIPDEVLTPVVPPEPLGRRHGPRMKHFFHAYTERNAQWWLWFVLLSICAEADESVKASLALLSCRR